MKFHNVDRVVMQLKCSRLILGRDDEVKQTERRKEAQRN